MMQKLYKDLSVLIQNSYISVANSPYETAYQLEIVDGIGQMHVINICSSVSHTGPNTVYARYEIYVNDELLVQALRPISLTNQREKIRRKNMSDVDKLEKLLRMCSNKIKQQETISQKNHMLKAMITCKEHIH